MKKTIFLLLLMWPCVSFAQETLAEKILSKYMNSAGDYSALYQGRLEPMFPRTMWTTHPYWSDSDVHEGEVCYEGRVYKNVKLRYNIFENILVVVSLQDQLSIVPDASKVSYFTMDGKRFINTGDGYLCVEQEGNCVSLMHDRRKSGDGYVIMNRTSVHNMKISDTYYLMYADGKMTEVSNARNFISSNLQYKKDLKKRMREEDIDFRQYRQLSLRRCTEYLDGLLEADGAEKSASRVADRLVSMPSAGIDSMPCRVVPESVFEDLDKEESAALAYAAYLPGSKVKYDYMEEFYASEEPGIDDMEPMRETHTLGEVEVVGFMQKVNTIQAGLEAFRPQMLKNIPLAMGEADVMKVTMMMPGVSSTGEASSGINVRGGATDQNLMLYNGNTIFYPMHMFGLFSAFNTDMIAETELYKGSMPSQYGGRLSSVMNIKGRVADKNSWHGSASIGLLTAKALLEVPIVKGKTSMMIGGRTTYSDWMLKLLSDKGSVVDYRDGNAGFWDLSTLISSKIGETNTLIVNGYVSNDHFSFTGQDNYAYRNINGSAEFKSYFTDDLTTSIIAGYDHFDYHNVEKRSAFSEAELTFNLDQFFLKGNLTRQLGSSHSLKAGVQALAYKIMPGRYMPKGSYSEVIGLQLDDDKGVESAIYCEDVWNISPELKVNGGVRLNMFNGLKDGKEKTYVNPDVRVSASYTMNENSSVKAGFNTSHQYIHKVSNTVIMSPTDTWLLSNEKIKPQAGYQISGGYYFQTSDKTYELSAEAYYKGMNNYLTYRAGSQLVMNEAIEKDVAPATGRAFGIELQLKKLYGKFNGWISYTYSRTQLQQKGNNEVMAINDGEWFSADYDTPHSLKIAANYKFTHRYSISVNADYSTGRPFTAPIGTFYDEMQDQTVALYSDRNNYRMPDYFRVDLSLNVEPSHKLTRKTRSWFSFGVYNLLGRKNAYSIYSEGGHGDITTYKLSIFGAPIPFVSYNIKF
ncbi:MAG: TonB-dependent receptor plug domain-containing protein [Bacteroidales bacterium]|nr:TonB-dependent receptor plug domain-containing protein [Bacteroidales bacterium]